MYTYTTSEVVYIEIYIFTNSFTVLDIDKFQHIYIYTLNILMDTYILSVYF